MAPRSPPLGYCYNHVDDCFTANGKRATDDGESARSMSLSDLLDAADDDDGQLDSSSASSSAVAAAARRIIGQFISDDAGEQDGRRRLGRLVLINNEAGLFRTRGDEEDSRKMITKVGGYK